MSVEVEPKSMIFNAKFWMLVKCENVNQSEVSVLSNQNDAKVSHCLVG